MEPPGTSATWFFLILAGLLFLLVAVGFLIGLLTVFRPWLRGMLSQAPVSLIEVVGMSLRGNPPGLLVDVLIILRHRGVMVSAAEVERTYIALGKQPMTAAELAERVQKSHREEV
jgi:uncharacterized protein YqfA (UPF0365 family)